MNLGLPEALKTGFPDITPFPRPLVKLPEDMGYYASEA
jgi:hypothetical protein